MALYYIIQTIRCYILLPQGSSKLPFELEKCTVFTCTYSLLHLFPNYTPSPNIHTHTYIYIRQGTINNLGFMVVWAVCCEIVQSWMLLLPTPLRKSVLYSARSAAPEKTERTSIYSFIYNNYFYPVAEYFLYTAIIVRYTPFAPLLTALPSQSLSPSLNVPFYCMGVVGRRLMEIVFHVMLLLWHFHMHFTKYTHTDTHIHRYIHKSHTIKFAQRTQNETRIPVWWGCCVAVLHFPQTLLN